MEGPNGDITFHESETIQLDKPHDDSLIIKQVTGFQLSRVMINIVSLVDVLFCDAFRRMGFNKTKVKGTIMPLTGLAGETTYLLGYIQLLVFANNVRQLVDFFEVD